MISHAILMSRDEAEEAVNALEGRCPGVVTGRGLELSARIRSMFGMSMLPMEDFSEAPAGFRLKEAAHEVTGTPV